MISPPQAVVFDLDDTLADTAGTVLQPAREDAFRALIAAGLDVTLDQLSEAATLLDPGTVGEAVFLRLAQRLRAPDPLACEAAALDAFYRTPRDGIRLMPGSRELLSKLSSKQVPMFLLTFGDPDVQRTKVSNLDINRFFKAVAFVDLRRGPDKTRALADLIERWKLPVDRTWVVGDRPDGEITAGNRLGCLTVRLRYGEFAESEPRTPEEQANLDVRSLRQLSRLL